MAPGAGPSGEVVLDRYLLEEVLGSGGFGTVWRARDERLEREVAVKVIPRERGESPGRAEREARVAARLNHPGIVALYELGSDDQAVYLVSELVHGATLAELYRERAVSDQDVARVGLALCDALEHAHDRGVVHRDVKPGNVLVVAEPAAGAGFAKLADFGVAHLAGGDPMTRTGDVVGTLAYMAPEQAEGERVDDAADVYSLALTLYEGWTGTNPVRAASPAATARRLGRRLPSLGARRRDLPAVLCEEIDAALDPDPYERPEIDELRDALAEALPDLASEGGLVEPATLERFGLERGPWLRGRLGAPLARLGAAAATGALTALGAAEAQSPPLAPAAAGVCCALLALFAPRAAWACAGLLVLVGLGAGEAVIVLAALAAVPMLLPRQGLLWPLPALAALLGALGAAPAFVAVAVVAAALEERAVRARAWLAARLAALGFVWLALTEILTGRRLLFGVADGTAPAASWVDSPGAAAADGIWPLLSSPAWAPLIVWAALAALLALLLRGRSLALGLVLAGAWGTALVSAHRALEDLLTTAVQAPDARGAVQGAVLGAALALAAAASGVLATNAASVDDVPLTR